MKAALAQDVGGAMARIGSVQAFLEIKLGAESHGPRFGRDECVGAGLDNEAVSVLGPDLSAKPRCTLKNVQRNREPAPLSRLVQVVACGQASDSAPYDNEPFALDH
jgi:hypothetical protein